MKWHWIIHSKWYLWFYHSAFVIFLSNFQFLSQFLKWILFNDSFGRISFLSLTSFFSADGVKIMIKATTIRRLVWNNHLVLTPPYLVHPHSNWKENIMLGNKSTTEIRHWILTIFVLRKHCEQNNKKEETLLNNHWILIKQRHMHSNRNISKGIEFGRCTTISKRHRNCSVNWFLKNRKTAQWTVLPWSIALIRARACLKCRSRDIFNLQLELILCL